MKMITIIINIIITIIAEERKINNKIKKKFS